MIRPLILQLLTVFVVVCSQVQDKDKLYILILAPFSGGRKPPPIFSRGHSLVPAVQLAVEHINNSTHILPNHTLEIIVGDSACNYGTETAVPFVKHIAAGNKQVLGIVGPACTEASLFLANLTQRNRYGIVQAMMATSNVFEDHQRYRHTFGMVSSFNVLVDKFLELSERRNWTNVVVFIDQSRKFFLQTFKSLQERAVNTSVTIECSWRLSAPDYVDRPLEELKNNRNRSTRVIFAIMSAESARHVACLADFKGIKYPNYQFIFADRSLNGSLAIPGGSFTSNGMNCTKDRIRRGLNGSIMLRYSLDSISSETFLNGTAEITVGEMRNQYRQKLKQYAQEQQLSEDLAESTYAYPYYDSTWAMAMSIHQAIQEVGSFNSSNPLFLNNSDGAELIRQKFEDLSFQGVSVNVKIDEATGHVTNVVDEYQVNGSKEITENISYIEDSYQHEYTHLHPALVAVLLLLMLAGFVVMLTLQLVSIHYRNYFSIKASSPRLNHFIFFSCYLLLIAMLIDTIQHGFLTEELSEGKKIAAEVLCNIHVFLFPLSLSIIISTVFVKLWRLYSIFNRSFKKQVLISDKHLALVILALQVCVIFLSIPWLSVDDARLKLEVISFNIIENKKQFESTCSTDRWFAFLPYLFVLIVTMLSFCLAYKNRKIRQTEYRSKETIVFTYLFCLMLGVFGLLLILTLLVDLTVHSTYFLSTTQSLCVILLCNIVLFLPPIYPILRGKDVNSKHPFISGRLKQLFHLT
ncbi:uncharacterized protein LOC135341692 [Halichondria panicea]|uniref:uncharacterized protein LOC135341692 n=1 Tax=Halichondria panicea TaxID=6063 RepID=UPI00312B7C52